MVHILDTGSFSQLLLDINPSYTKGGGQVDPPLRFSSITLDGHKF